MRSNKHVFAMLPTGGGKTVVFSSITNGAFNKGFRVWIIVPRDELLNQASAHFDKYSLPHGIINAKNAESQTHSLHLVSKNTIERRYDKIINWPDLIIIDEGHLNYKFLVNLKKIIPDRTRMILFSATPERLSGEGLSDICDDIIYGASISELIELRYLCPIKYYAPPLEGIENLHKKGSDVDAKELKKLFKEKSVYGKAIDHYRKMADGKSCMVFCRSVEASKETADQFNSAGYKFKSIDGKMSYKVRKSILAELETGEINGICSCELTIYGIDIARIEVIIMLRPTFSLAYFLQMIGRGLRPFEGKEHLIILDHVNNVLKHGHPLIKHEWKFYGKNKKGSGEEFKKPESTVCPMCSGCWPGLPDICPDCGCNLHDEREHKAGRKLPKEIEGILREVMPFETDQYITAVTDQAIRLQKMDKGSRMKAMVSNVYKYGRAERVKGLARVVGYSENWVNATSYRIRKR